MSGERPRFGSVIGFSIGSLEITALVLATMGAVVALLAVNKAGLGAGLVVLWVPISEAALPPIVHRLASGSAHVVRVLACLMILSWMYLSPPAIGYLFIPAAATMVAVAVWSGRQRRGAIRAAAVAQRRQRRGGQKGGKKRSRP